MRNATSSKVLVFPAVASTHVNMLLVSGVQDTILILRRSVQMPKHLWRQPSTCRTLLPILLEPIVGQALQGRTSHHPTGYGVVEAELSIDGDHLEKRTERTGRIKKDWSGVFNVITVCGQVKLSLSQEACHREVYTPRRSTQHLATLKPWEPIRALLNGKADWSSGRYFYLQDYHVLLCRGEQPSQLSATRTYDFQADLF